MALGLAQAALRLQRWELAAELWQALLRHFPDARPNDAMAAVDALQRAGRGSEADRVLCAATERWPACDPAWHAAIHSALEQQDWQEALRRWHGLVAGCPAPRTGFRILRERLRAAVALSSPRFADHAVDLGLRSVGSVICEDPVIILATGEVFEVVERTGPYYRDRVVHFFIGMLWTTVGDPNYRQRFKEAYDRLIARYPSFRITVLANDVAELLVLRELGVPAELVNHNAFVDDTVFDILPVEQTFDAIYNARLGLYKRHHLAAGIDKLKLIVTLPTAEQLAEAKRLLPGCVIANQRENAIVNLSAQEVAYHLNTAKCGLCLSRIEGSMFSSIEYLLCGLPVVTTRNSGGRNWYFANDYVITCDDDPAAVAEAVARISREPIPRPLIRESARQKMRRDRLVFFELVNRVFAELGHEGRRIEPEFAKWYRDKINYTGRAIEEFLVP